MEQSKLISLIEACVNVGLGFFVSLGVWFLIIVPLWHLDVSPMESLGITCVFTVFAIIRSYAVRRFFATKIHKMAIAMTKTIDC